MVEGKEESQKLQARTLDGSTAPHCKHVFVTGNFCAADARTPVRSEPDESNIEGRTKNGKLEGMFRIRYQEITGYRPRGGTKSPSAARACRD
jgi:hypothetical protein